MHQEMVVCVQAAHCTVDELPHSSRIENDHGIGFLNGLLTSCDGEID